MNRETDEARNNRIRREILTDADSADEETISWWHYLEREMSVPFQARCIEERTISPLREHETVRVVGMTDEVVSSSELFVLVEWMDREFGVPLSQLEGLNVDHGTGEAVDDWHFWTRDGGRSG